MMKGGYILLKCSLKNKIMRTITKKNPKKLTKLNSSKKFKINTLTPNFKFINKAGRLEDVENCYI